MSCDGANADLHQDDTKSVKGNTDVWEYIGSGKWTIFTWRFSSGIDRLKALQDKSHSCSAAIYGAFSVNFLDLQPSTDWRVLAVSHGVSTLKGGLSSVVLPMTP